MWWELEEVVGVGGVSMARKEDGARVEARGRGEQRNWDQNVCGFKFILGLYWDPHQAVELLPDRNGLPD